MVSVNGIINVYVSYLYIAVLRRKYNKIINMNRYLRIIITAVHLDMSCQYDNNIK